MSPETLEEALMLPKQSIDLEVGELQRDER